jgi:hypothetical protein
MSMLYDSTFLYDRTGFTYNGLPTGIPGLPNVGVFLAFNASPYEPNPMWTDVTEYVRQIPSIRRARSDDWSTFTGTASLVLNNRDQRFNPFNTLSPYNGWLKPRMQIKIVAVAGENDYNLFRGYVAGWPVDWSEQGLDSTVTIECFDALALLASEQLPPDWSQRIISSLNPNRFFKFDEIVTPATAGDAVFKDYGSDQQDLIRYSASYNPPTNTPALALGVPSVAITASRAFFWRSALSTQGSDWQSGATWFTIDPNRSGFSAVPFQIGFNTTSPSVFTWGFLAGYTASTGVWLIRMALGSGSSTTIYTWTSAAKFLNNDVPHHFAFKLFFPPSGVGLSLQFFLDGEEIPSTFTTPSGTLGPYRGIETDFGAGMQHMAYWRRELTTAELQLIYAAGRALIQETTSARFNRIIAETPFPTSLVSVPASPVGVVSAISVNSASVVSELNLIRNSEGGELYTDKNGVITMTQRDSQFAGRSSTTQAVFKDDGTALDYANNFSLGFDADTLVNELRYELSGDTTATASDVVSQNAYGFQSSSITTQLATVASAQELANTKLTVFADPIPTVSPLEVGITRNLSEWQTLLNLEVLDQIEITRSSPVGSPFFERLLVNEIVHSISTEDWSMQITGSARYTGVLILDDAVYGLLDEFVLG